MANLVDKFELDGLREDMFTMLGMADEGGGDRSIVDAKTLVTIYRIIDKGSLNTTTHLYESPISEVVYTGPAYISPVTYRRDRQEIGGDEAVRIRQYRGIVPWDAGDIHLQDILNVLTCTDPEFIGKFLDITDVLYESELAVRRISLVDTTKDISGLGC